MHEISLNDVEATLTELFDGVLRGEEFAITRHGRKEAVVISWTTWRRLRRLLAEPPLSVTDIGERDRTSLRDLDP